MITVCYEYSCNDNCCYTMKIHKKSNREGFDLINFTEVYVKKYDINYIVNDVNTTITTNNHRILTKFDFSIPK